jgi:hypothetical protein
LAAQLRSGCGQTVLALLTDREFSANSLLLGPMLRGNTAALNLLSLNHEQQWDEGHEHRR